MNVEGAIMGKAALELAGQGAMALTSRQSLEVGWDWCVGWVGEEL